MNPMKYEPLVLYHYYIIINQYEPFIHPSIDPSRPTIKATAPRSVFRRCQVSVHGPEVPWDRWSMGQFGELEPAYETTNIMKIMK